MKKFFEKNGFYVVLLLCIAIVAIGAVIMTNGNFNKIAKKQAPHNNSAEDKASPDISQKNNNNMIEEINKQLNEKNAKENNKNTVTQPQSPQASAKKNDVKVSANKQTGDVTAPVANATPVYSSDNANMIMPVNGKITTDYSLQAYSKTLDEWKTHRAIDISAAAGTPVKAAMAGKVIFVGKDKEGLGNTVIIQHNGSLQTKYSSLAEDIKVKQGQLVKQGDVIGAVGQSASFELLDGGNHVHFEVLKGTQKVDPNDYIKK